MVSTHRPLAEPGVADPVPAPFAGPVPGARTRAQGGHERPAEAAAVAVPAQARPCGERVQLTVETPGTGLRLIRVTGALDRAAAATLLRLLDAQLHETTGRRRRTTHVLVDLSGVRSFEPGGLETLRHARHCAARSGIGVHLTGCADRSPYLPLRAYQVLTEFHTYPTTEIALAALTDEQP